MFEPTVDYINLERHWWNGMVASGGGRFASDRVHQLEHHQSITQTSPTNYQHRANTEPTHSQLSQRISNTYPTPHRNIAKHQNIINTTPTHHQRIAKPSLNITSISQVHPWNIAIILHSQLNTNTRPIHHQSITNKSPKHRQNITNTSSTPCQCHASTSRRHCQNSTNASPDHHQNIIETAREYHRRIRNISLSHRHRIPIEYRRSIINCF